MERALVSRKNDCKSCYKCIRNCPTKAISFSDNQASIIYDDCILCGECFKVCPQHVKIIRDDKSRLEMLIDSGAKVVATVAPSFMAEFPNVSFEEFKKALLKIGFSDAIETAVGATIVKKVYDEMLLKGDREILISSCCHSVNLLIEKHYPDLVKYLADVASPMEASGQYIKESDPETKVVFIGPCIAKKDESDKSSNIDLALTFLELRALFYKYDVKLETTSSEDIRIKKSKARLFPTCGGILRTMDKSASKYDYIAVDGATNVINCLEDIRANKIKNCFIEMSICPGSCSNGPAMTKNVSFLSNQLNVTRNAGEEDFDVREKHYEDIQKDYDKYGVIKAIPSEEKIKETLISMGKSNPKKELNCGSCGYATCREKAIAILQGKAVKEMCLPWLMEKAENFSDVIVSNSPNGIMVLDESLNIQLMNSTLKKMLGLSPKLEVIGTSVGDYLSEENFALALVGQIIKDKEEYLSNYDIYVRESIEYNKNYNCLICVFRDVTAKKLEHLRKDNTVKKAVEITEEVIEKNMRAVQEIASLLGESAAETKVALNALQETIKNEK